MKMTLKGALGFTVLSLLMPCLLLCLQAGDTTHPPTASELQPLQGTWEGFLAGNKAAGKITITITGNSLHFHRDKDFWFETTFTLPADTDPQQLHATIKRCATPDLIGKVVVSIFKIEDGTLILAGFEDPAAKPPKIFEGEGIMRHEFRKVQPQKKNTELPKSK
jgi:uncharacterized protein (TIGR03067 family)